MGAAYPIASTSGNYSLLPPVFVSGGMIPVVWQYQAGYFHSALSEEVSSGSSTITVTPNTLSGDLTAIYAGLSLKITDYNSGAFETVVVQDVSGSTITLASPLTQSFTLPVAPDFISVSAVPQTLVDAAMFVVAATILSGGQQAIVLSAKGAPSGSTGSDVEAMLDQARYRIKPYQALMV
jgi:hypothetical protein